MSLENLKSVFEEELNDGIENFSSNIIISRNGTQLFNTPPQPTQFIVTNPTDFSSAVGNNALPYTPLNLPFPPQGTTGGKSFLEGLSWEKLYNSNHTPKGSAEHKGITAQSYQNVNRDNLKIGKRTPNIEQYGFSRGDEPYVVSSIGNGGRDKNKGGRSTPITRALTDGDRIISYLTSADGIVFILKQNINVPIKNTVIRKNGSLVRVPQRYGVVYNPLSTVLATSGRLLGQGIPNILFRKQGLGGSDAIAESIRGWEQFKPPGGDALADLLSSKDNVYRVGNPAPYSINDSFTKAGDNQAGAGNGFLSQLQNAVSNINPFSGEVEVPKTITGDKVTLATMIKGDSLAIDTSFGTSAVGNTTFNQAIPINIDSAENGMPFYFKDLRDNTYIFFRAYIEGLTENISPSYAPHNYVGRSETVYTYERAEREISMTLKLVAQTKDELEMIYKKMDRLTSLCYPQYIDDDYGNRMKPPLTKLRIGEMFGKTNKEQLGYIKSISYAVDNSSTYETEVGKRVPRHVIATIGYQIIHEKVPRLGTTFYGINETDVDNTTDDGTPGGFQDSSPVDGGNLGQQEFY